MSPAWLERLEDFPFAVDITDSNNYVIFVNRAFERFYGYPRAKVLGLLPHFLVPDSVDRNSLKASMRQVVENHRAWMGVQPNVTASGARKEIFLVALPIVAPETFSAGFIYFAADVSDWNKLVLAVLDLMAPRAFGEDFMMSPPGAFGGGRKLGRKENISRYYQLGFTAKQIATMMSISPSTVRAVKSQLRLGRCARKEAKKRLG